MGSTNSPKSSELGAELDLFFNLQIGIRKSTHADLYYGALGTETITVYVGPKRKKFFVHKKLICDHSDYFSKAFKGGFQEAERGVMYLAEDDIKAFHSFVNFIYRNTLPKFVKNKDPPTRITAGFYTEHKLFPLFYLAEKYYMNELANKAIDAIQDFQLEHDKFQVRRAFGEFTRILDTRANCVYMELYVLFIKRCETNLTSPIGILD